MDHCGSLDIIIIYNDIYWNKIKKQLVTTIYDKTEKIIDTLLIHYVVDAGIKLYKSDMLKLVNVAQHKTIYSLGTNTKF